MVHNLVAGHAILDHDAFIHTYVVHHRPHTLFVYIVTPVGYSWTNVSVCVCVCMYGMLCGLAVVLNEYFPPAGKKLHVTAHNPIG